MRQFGILGDGQLAQMLAIAAKDLGIQSYSIGSKNSPAAQVIQTEKAPLDKTDHFIVESEFYNFESLSSENKEKVFPQMASITTLKNKLNQKKILDKLNIPTSPYEILKEDSIPRGTDKVLKWAEFGYDGKGTLLIHKNTKDSEIQSFVKSARERGTQVYAEDKISFKKELSLVVVRSKNSFVSYPLVESIQKNGVCKSVRTFQSNKNLQDLAENYAKKLGGELNLLGTFAIEFFYINETLIVNEIAPRVHNTGHWTQILQGGSQFHLHWKALLNQSLDLPIPPKYYEMSNLLGSQTFEVVSSPKDILLPEGLELHWYEKLECRPGRKMGHLNIFSNSERIFDNLKEEVVRIEREIWNLVEGKQNGQS